MRRGWLWCRAGTWPHTRAPEHHPVHQVVVLLGRVVVLHLYCQPHEAVRTAAVRREQHPADAVKRKTLSAVEPHKQRRHGRQGQAYVAATRAMCTPTGSVTTPQQHRRARCGRACLQCPAAGGAVGTRTFAAWPTPCPPRPAPSSPGRGARPPTTAGSLGLAGYAYVG